VTLRFVAESGIFRITCGETSQGGSAYENVSFTKKRNGVLAMSGRISLNGIPELNLAGKVNSMTDAEFSSYINDLNAFVDGFPAQASKLRNDMSTRKYGDLARDMLDICDSLSKIYANELALESRGKMNALDISDSDEVEAFIEQFILDVSSLSIEIQIAAHKSRQNAPPPRPAHTDARISILAVDNAVMFLNTLKRLLADTQYDLNCFTSGHDALRFLESNRPDVILMDIEMPDMDGYELTRRIRQRDSDTPIIFITANSAREYVDKALEVGGASVLMKPIRINQLLAKLKEFT